MKPPKILGFAAAAAVALMAVIGVGTASATALTSPEGTVLKTGSTIHMVNSGTSTLTTTFKNITCSESTVQAKTTNESGTAISASVESLTWGGCNCEVKTLKGGTFSITSSGGGNGAFSSSSAEITVNCSTIFGTAHCIYATGAGTSLGTLTGSSTTGSTATLDIAETNIPRLATSAICAEKAHWDATYKVDKPDSLLIESEAGGGPTSTSLTTSLSGEAKSGEEITVNEGAKVKDTATLSGTNAGKATGKVKFRVYKDKECKELAAEAGEGSLSEGKATSEEKTLEAGAVYYWQAEYPGDSNNLKSTSACGKEVLTVKAATSLSTSLSGEAKSGEEITVNEGAKVKDTATLSGTNAGKATGKVKFRVYKDKECKELATEAGEPSVSGGTAESEEKTLTAGIIYYWQASYEGDSLHQASTSSCGEVETVKAATSIATTLFGESPEGEGPIEAEEITITEGQLAVDSAMLSGTNSATATGEVSFAVYSDSECKTLVTGAGSVPASAEGAISQPVALEAGTYYWQATYEGDSLHQSSTSTCGDEVVKVKAALEISTSLSGGGEEGEEILVEEGVSVTDTATLSGPKSSSATGTLKYAAYEDAECKELAAEAGEFSVSEGKTSTSKALTLEPGVYFWQVEYSGDASNSPSITPCGAEVLEQAPANVTLRKENAAGAALALTSEVEGESAGWSLTSPALGAVGGEVISCTENKFVGEVMNNAGAPKAGAAVVAVKSWVFKKGGLKDPNKCATTAKDPRDPAHPILDAEIDVLKKGTLHFPAPPAGMAPPAKGWLKDFELRMKLFNQAGVEKYVCKYRQAAVKTEFTLGAALGLDLKALDAQRLKKNPAGSSAICWGELLASGLFTVETKPVVPFLPKPVVPTSP